MDFPQEDQVIASRILKEQFGILGCCGDHTGPGRDQEIREPRGGKT